MPTAARRRRRDETPLLSHNSSNEPKKKGLLSIFGRSSAPNHPSPRRRLDTRRLRLPQGSTTTTPSAPALPVVSSNAAAPKALEENRKDSTKKARPFPVPLRGRSQYNPSAQDPPSEHDDEKKVDYESVKMISPVPTPATTPASGGNDSCSDVDSTESSTFRSLPPTPPASPRRSSAKTLLGREFGRHSLGVQARKWVAEVSAGEWDAEAQRWKYRILLQSRAMKASSSQASSLTTAFTWRSLDDFLWLEQALRQEFDGGLWLPDLPTAIGRTPNSSNIGMPVEASRLRDWLNDVFNGVRGQGELILEETPDILHADAMETFLYKSSSPTDDDDDVYTIGDGTTRHEEDAAESILTAIFSKPLELCVGPDRGHLRPPSSTRSTPDRSMRATPRLPLDLMTCSSRAIGTAPSLDVQDSLVASQAGSANVSSSLVFHSELVEAERELTADYRATTTMAMERVQVLQQEEDVLGVGWKRLATTLTSLFAYEKDVETAKLGGDLKVAKDRLPFRKINKSRVEDLVAILAKHRADRSVPALHGLALMLSAYAGDLSAVGPSVDAYNAATEELARWSEQEQVAWETAGGNSGRDWEARFKSMASATLDDVKNHAIRSFQKEQRSQSQSPEQRRRSAALAARHDRLLANERMLRNSLTLLCRATPIRTARMAWRYWHTEATQAALVNTAAVALKLKMDVADHEAVSSMIHRHLVEEREDSARELDLIARMIGIRNNVVKKFHVSDASSVSVTDESGQPVEVDTDVDHDERIKAVRRGRALEVARERVGRWDSKLSMAIMEAIEVEDANVRVEEAGRDLRLVRKYAIGLREQLNRCVEAVQLLMTAYGPDGRPDANGRRSKGVFEMREDLLVHLSVLFSGKLSTEDRGPRRLSTSLTVLARAGIDTTDPLGWTAALSKSPSRRAASFDARVGELARAYYEVKDSQTLWLLKSIHGLLMEYFERVEAIEGFVYMECIGIQLEKHFSEQRGVALSAFEKKTDITSALNVAKRKRLTKLVADLQTKLEAIGPEVSHTLVKETKEMHLESKNLKAELHDLAMRRLTRAREASTEKIVTILTLWAKEEENAATSDLKALAEAMAALERAVGSESFEPLVQSLSYDELPRESPTRSSK